MKGVLVMAYGSPNSLDEIEPFYTDIRRGVPPTPELLDELTERYKAIGGSSPLLEITWQQAKAIEKALGKDYKAYVGMRHWEPWIKDAVKQMKTDGIKEAAAVVMAPHFSGMSIAKYMEKVEEAISEIGADIKMEYIKSWHDHPLLIEAFAGKIAKAREHFDKSELENLLVIFTAHSLPERILRENDPYKAQLLETCRLLAKKMNLKHWDFAFQSAGHTKEKWLGPDLLEVIEDKKGEGFTSVLVCSVGFITDHLEVMYDIDFEAKQKAEDLGMHLERAGSLNADPLLGELMAELIRKKIG